MCNLPVYWVFVLLKSTFGRLFNGSEELLRLCTLTLRDLDVVVASYSITASVDGCAGRSVGSVGNLTTSSAGGDDRSEKLGLVCHICNGDCSTSLYPVVGRCPVNGCCVVWFPCEIASICGVVCFNVVKGSGISDSAWIGNVKFWWPW